MKKYAWPLATDITGDYPDLLSANLACQVNFLCSLHPVLGMRQAIVLLLLDSEVKMAEPADVSPCFV